MSNFRKYLDNVQKEHYNEIVGGSLGALGSISRMHKNSDYYGGSNTSGDGGTYKGPDPADFIPRYISSVENNINNLKKEINQGIMDAKKAGPMGTGAIQSLQEEMARVNKFEIDVKKMLPYLLLFENNKENMSKLLQLQELKN
jgi:hypothetical protein